MEHSEVDTLVASLQAAQKTSPKDSSIMLEYQRVFGSPAGAVVLSDLVKRFPIIAPRFIAGQTTEQAAQRDGAAQVIAHIIQFTISKPKQEMKKSPVKRSVKPRETKQDIQ